VLYMKRFGFEMCCQVLACCDVSFPGVRQNWCVDRFCWHLVSGCGVGTVGNEIRMAYGVVMSAAKEESTGGEKFGFLDAEFFE